MPFYVQFTPVLVACLLAISVAPSTCAQEQEASTFDSGFQKCTGSFDDDLSKLASGALASSFFTERLTKAQAEKRMQSYTDRVKAIAHKQSECLKEMRRNSDEEKFKRWYMERTWKNSTIYQVLDQLVVDSNGKLIPVDTPLPDVTRRRLESGLNKAAVYLRAYHNAYLEYIRSFFPTARALPTTDELHLCNSKDTYHQFMCNPIPECPFKQTTAIITSSRTIRAALQSTPSMVFGYDPFNKLDPQSKDKALKTEKDDTNIDKGPSDSSADSLPKEVAEMKGTLEAYARAVQIVRRGNIEAICKTIKQKPYEDYIRCGEWNNNDAGVKDAFLGFGQEIGFRYFYNTMILFLLAHEQGHIVLHKQLICGGNLSGEQKKKIELEADNYAEVLLDLVAEEFRAVSPVYQSFSGLGLMYTVSEAYAAGIFEYDASYPTPEERTQSVMEVGMKEEESMEKFTKLPKSHFSPETVALANKLLAKTYIDALGMMLEENELHEKGDLIYPNRTDIFYFHSVPFVLEASVVPSTGFD
jgi:hypothetical protein